MKRYMVLFTVVSLVLVGKALADSPVDVTVVVGVCEPTTFTATSTDGVASMYLVVDTDDGPSQYIKIPANTGGTGVTLSVGPFGEDTTVYWHVFGGGERDYDIPLWNDYGEAGFTDAINEYDASVGNSFSWVLAGTDDPNPFVTWYSVEVPACKPARLNGGGHLLEEMGSKRKDWYDVSFGGQVKRSSDGSLEGEFQVDLHNVGDDSLDGSKFHGTDVVDLNLFEGNNDTCTDVANFTINGTFDGEPGYSMIFRAGDNGSPNNVDTVRITIHDGEDASGTVVYDTHDAGEFTDESDCVGTARTGLDTGNFTISQK